MTLTPSQASEAERLSHQQRLGFASWVVMDEARAKPDQEDLCRKVIAAAETDPLNWDAMLGQPAVNALFVQGALLFRRPLPE